MSAFFNFKRFAYVIFAALLLAGAALPQTAVNPFNAANTPDGVAIQTTAFTYQGRLTDAGTGANGTYDFEFALFTDASSGTAIGTETRAGVTVASGVFTVQLDFGAAAFPGDTRYLEIRVKRQGATNYTTLAPRQQITSTPFAIRAINAETATTANNTLSVGGTPAANIIKEGDSRLSDARQPAAGSDNYVQNTETQQSSVNFNISGNGTAGGSLSGGVVNSATSFNIGNTSVLSIAGTENLFAGAFAGFSNTTGSRNSFFGSNAGQRNTSGNFNSFLGADAGLYSTGSGNSFVGWYAGYDVSTGSNNSFFGRSAGNDCPFFTSCANFKTGDRNSAFGYEAGSAILTGSDNTLIGSGANVGAGNLNFATAIGAGAMVNSPNSVVLGRQADTVRIPGNLSLSGTFSGNYTVPAANVTGTLNAAQIPNLDAGKTTSGTFDAARIPNLAASYIQNSTAQQNGNFNLNGNGTLGGAFTANSVSVGASGLALNDNLLKLRSGGDGNHGILYSPTANGPEFRAFDGFRWTNGINGATERMRLDALGNLTVGGNIQTGANGNLFAASGEENLRIAHGHIQVSNGNVFIINGTGYSVTRHSTGVFTITFTNAFGGGIVLTPSFLSNVPLSAVQTYISENEVRINVYALNGAAADPLSLLFIAVGKR